MIFNLNSDEPMGESTQVAYYELDKALDEEINDFENFIQNTDYAYELEENMKNGVKKGIIAYLKKKGIVFDESDDRSIWKALSKLYKSHGFNQEKLDKVRRVVKDKWIINGTWSTDKKKRKNMYDLCMVLNMNIDETKKFFSKYFYTLPFNYKNRIDAIYYYCIYNKKNCSETRELIESAGKQNDDVIDDKNTFEIERQILDIDNDDDFLIYVKKYCFSEWKQIRTSRMVIKELYEDSIECYKMSEHYQDYLKMILEEEIEKGKITTTDQEEKRKEQLKRRKIKMKQIIDDIYGFDIQKQKQEKGFSISKGIPIKSFIESIPKYMEISKILNTDEKEVSYDVIRKAIIIFNFYSFYLNIENEELYRDEEKIKEDLHDFVVETNERLERIGYNPFYVKSPFDWLVLYCANTPEPLWTFKQFFLERYLDSDDNEKKK